MIHPDLATMLAVVTTDYPLEPGEAIDFLRPAVEASLQRDLGRRRVLDERLRDPARERRERRRRATTRRSRRRSPRSAPTSRGRSSPTARASRCSPRSTVSGARRRRAGEGDRAADRHLAAREDRALRPRRELGPGADGRRQRAVERRLRGRSTPSGSRSATTARSSSTTARRPTSSRTSRGPTCTIELDLGLGDGPRRLPDERPLLRLRPHQRGLPDMTRLVVKVGGAVAESRRRTCSSSRAGHEVCVVHGAGPQISLEMERAGIPVEFVERPARDDRARGSRSSAVVRAPSTRRSAPRSATRAVPLFGDEIGLEARPGARARARRRGAARRAARRRSCGARRRARSRSSRRSPSAR